MVLAETEPILPQICSWEHPWVMEGVWGAPHHHHQCSRCSPCPHRCFVPPAGLWGGDTAGSGVSPPPSGTARGSRPGGGAGGAAQPLQGRRGSPAAGAMEGGINIERRWGGGTAASCAGMQTAGRGDGGHQGHHCHHCHHSPPATRATRAPGPPGPPEPPSHQGHHNPSLGHCCCHHTPSATPATTCPWPLLSQTPLGHHGPHGPVHPQPAAETGGSQPHRGVTAPPDHSSWHMGGGEVMVELQVLEVTSHRRGDRKVLGIPVWLCPGLAPQCWGHNATMVSGQWWHMVALVSSRQVWCHQSPVLGDSRHGGVRPVLSGTPGCSAGSRQGLCHQPCSLVSGGGW